MMLAYLSPRISTRLPNLILHCVCVGRSRGWGWVCVCVNIYVFVQVGAPAAQRAILTDSLSSWAVKTSINWDVTSTYTRQHTTSPSSQHDTYLCPPRLACFFSSSSLLARNSWTKGSCASAPSSKAFARFTTAEVSEDFCSCCGGGGGGGEGRGVGLYVGNVQMHM